MATKAKITRKANSVAYSEADIQSLDYPENIQRRPGMYVGGTGSDALHHLVYEVIDNAVDEAMADACTHISVTIHADGSVTVADNGRGIPAGLHPEKKKSTLELVFTELHTGGKFGSGGYSTSGGLHGVGVKATNALSEWLEVRVQREGVVYFQRHEKGLPVNQVQVQTGQGKVLGHIGEAKLPAAIKKHAARKQTSGTTISFKPNPEYLDTVEFNFEQLAHRLQEIAFQVPALTIELVDQRQRKRGKKSQELRRTFHYEGGLVEWVDYLNNGLKVLHKKPIHIRETVEAEAGKNKVRLTVEIAMQYHADTNAPDGTLISTVNTIPTPDGGKHVSGFRAGLTKAINAFAAEKKMLKGKGTVSGKDVLYGLTAVVKLLMPDPQFTSQTKTQLASDYIQGVVNSVAYNNILDFFRKQVSIGRAVVRQCQVSAEARQAEAKVRASIMRKSILEVSELPGKLADCDSRTDPLLTALYIVEGDSAGGSCKMARDRRFQAILPTRGKIMNVWRTNLNKAMNSAEIKSIISSIGGGVGTDFNLDDMRYGMIVIMVDADVDGGHIGSLLLTLGYKFMRKMVAAGRLYWAVAPLYQLKRGKERFYAYSDEERDKILKRFKGKNVEVQRYKGLGEMNPDQLRETVFAIDEEQLVKAQQAVAEYEAALTAYQEARRNGHGGNGDDDPGDKPVFHPVPLNRHLVQVTLEDIHAAQQTVELLMGSAVPPRKSWLMDQMRDEEGIG
ncbi:MAG: type IIA DNA topoisomerase subunit B [Anaerolineae bacterium]